MKKILALVMTLLLVLSLVACGGGNSLSDTNNDATENQIDKLSEISKTFDNAYPDLSYSLASDNSYLEIDTNPDDLDYDDLYGSEQTKYERVAIEGMRAIKYANRLLGFSDALYKKMENTTSIMGRQTEENDEYTVTWNYHPDYGLNVLYEKK